MRPIEIVDSWTAAQGTNGDHALILRVRDQLRHLVGHPALTHRLTVAWTYLIADEHAETGLPTPDQQAEMAEFEDRLVDALEAPAGSPLAVLTEVATSGGVREWVWYAVPEQALETQINVALQHRPDYPIQLAMEADPAWTHYTELLAALGV